jgi:hypothetical protein
LYEVHSTDGGYTWSDAAAVFLIEEPELWATAVQLDTDGHGRLHAVWPVWSSRGVSDYIYYARLDAARGHWSTPTLLAKRDRNEYEADWPNIIVHNNQVIVVYQDGPGVTTKWVRRSLDGGDTWTEPVRPFPHGGEYGAVNLLIDSSNVLHMILGNRTPDQTHGLWHSVWLGDRWDELEPIVSGPQTSQFDPTVPRSVISQGNVLLATWSKDTTAGPRNGVWYSYARLDAPELPVLPLPVRTFWGSAVLAAASAILVTVGFAGIVRLCRSRPGDARNVRN